MAIKKYFLDDEVMKNDFLTFHFCVRLNKKLWVYSNRFSACFCIDPISGKSSFEGWGMGCPKRGCGIFTVGFYKSYLISISRWGKYVEVLDIQNGKRKICNLNYLQSFGEIEVYHMVIKDNNLILSVYDHKGIFIFNIDEIIAGEEVKVKVKIDNNIAAMSSIILVEEYLICLSREQAMIEVVNLENNTYQNFIITDSYLGIADMVFSDNKVFILYVSGDVAIYEISTAHLLDYYKIDEQDKSYMKLFWVKDKLWVFPSTKGDIFTIDLSNKLVKKYDGYPSDFQFLFDIPPHPQYAAFSEDEEYVYIGQRSTNYMMLIDKNSGNEKWVQIKLSRTFFEDILPYAMVRSALNEGDSVNGFSINELLHCLDFVEMNGVKGYKERDSVGKKIYMNL